MGHAKFHKKLLQQPENCQYYNADQPLDFMVPPAHRSQCNLSIRRGFCSVGRAANGRRAIVQSDLRYSGRERAVPEMRREDSPPLGGRS